MMVFVLVALAVQKTWIRNGDWLSEESLYKSGLAVLPNNAKVLCVQPLRILSIPL